MNPEDLTATLRTLTLGLIAVQGTNLVLALLALYRARVLGKATFARFWSLRDVWVGAQIALALTFALGLALMIPLALILGAFASGVSPLKNETHFLVFLGLPLTIVQNAVFFAVPAVAVTQRYGLSLRAIGLPARPRPRDWWAGIGVGLLLLIVTGGLETGLHALAEALRHDVGWIEAALRYEQNNPVARIAAALPRLGGGALVLAILTIGIAAPLGEEMFFRAFLFNALKRRLGVPAGLIVSGLLFAALHTYALGLLPVFLIGVLLAWAYHNSGSLWTSILAHAVNNTVVVLFAYFLPSAPR